VKKEMTDEKGLDAASADKIGEYVKHKGAQLFLSSSPTVLIVKKAADRYLISFSQMRH